MSLKKAKIDPQTNALVVIPYEHYELHGESAFTIHYTVTTANSDDHRTGIVFKTPAGSKKAHMTIEVTASHPAEAFLLEGPTIDDDPGANIVTYNRDRSSSVTSILTSKEATGTAGEVTTLTEAQIAAASFSGGTELDYMILAGGEGPKAFGGQDRSAQEWILKPSTVYMVYLKNIGANTNIHLLRFDWYEHTDKV